MEEEFKDITETGPTGLKGLSFSPTRPLSGVVQDTTASDTEDADLDSLLNSVVTRQDVNNYYKYAPPLNYQEFSIGDDFGSSKYDKQGILSASDIENYRENRAEQQSAVDKWGNALAKFVIGTAATVIDGTIGTAAGLVTGVANMFDDNPDTSFWSGLWDNAVTRGIANVNDWAEKTFVNNYSEWERNAPWYQRLGTANFWADGVLKNMGFMAGTAATMFLTGGIGSVLSKGRTIAKGAQFGQRAATALLAAHGEAAIEAVNSTRASMEALDYNLQTREQALRNQLQQEMLNDMNTLSAGKGRGNILKANDDGTFTTITNADQLNDYYRQKAQKLEDDIATYNDNKQRQITAAGNTVYLANVAFLLITNKINMGSLIKGGYNSSKSLARGFKQMVGDAEAKSVGEFAKAVVEGVGRYGQDAIKNINAKTVGKAALNMFSEGVIQEGGQSEISTAAEMNLQAKLNAAARETLLGASINPDVSEELIDFTKALGEAYNTQFGTIGSRGWEEVFIGALSAGIGMPTFKRMYNPSTKQYENKFRWNTAFTEAYDDLRSDYLNRQSMIDQLNDYVTDPNNGVIRNFRHAVAQSTLNKLQNNATERGDIQDYKNLEMQMLVENMFYFKESGKLDDYLAMLDALSAPIDDDTLNQVIALTVDEETGKSPLQSQDRNTLKQTYSEKAQSIKQKLNSITESINLLENDKRLDNFDDIHRRDALKELAYYDALLKDTRRRIESLESENEQLQGISPIEQQQKEDNFLAIRNLQRQEDTIQTTINKWLDNPEILTKKIDDLYQMAFRSKLMRDQASTVQMYKSSTNLRELLDTYLLADPTYRDSALQEAKNSSTDEVKAFISQFEDFMSDVDIVTDLVRDVNTTSPNQGQFDLNIIKDLTDDILETQPDLSRDNIKSAIDNYISNLAETRDALLAEGYNIRAGQISSVINRFQYYSNQMDSFDSIRGTIEAHKAARASSKKPQPITQPTIQPTPTQQQQSTPAQQPQSVQKGTRVESIEGFEDLNINVSTKDYLDNAKRQGIIINSDEDQKAFVNARNKYVGEKGVAKTKENLEGLYRMIELIKNGLHISQKHFEFLQKAIEDNKNFVQEWYNNKYGKPVEIQYQEPEEVTPEQEVNNDAQEQQDAEEQSNNSPEEPVIAEEQTEQSQFQDSGTNEGFRGNTFPKYKRSDLTKHKLTEVEHSNKEGLAEWLKNQPFYKDIQTLIDNFIGRFPKDTKIRYMHVNGRNDLVLLSVKYDDVSSLVARDRFSGNIVDTNDGEYLIIGTLGVESLNTPIGKNFNKIKDDLNNKADNTPFYVDTDLYNKIKAITEGTTIYYDQSDNMQVRDVNEMLNDPTANVHNMSADNLSFVVITGKRESPICKIINANPSMTIHRPSSNIPGQVYLVVPTAKKGVYTTVFVRPQLFGDNPFDTEFGRELTQDIRILADVSQPIADRQSAASRIRNKLIFERGHYFAINDNGSTKIMDNQNTEFLDLGTDLEEAVLTMQAALRQIAPRVNLKIAVLTSNPKYYLQSGLLTTDARTLGTVGSNFYIYDVNQDGTPNTSQGQIQPVEQQAEQQSQQQKDNNATATGIVYVEGIKYRILGIDTNTGIHVYITDEGHSLDSDLAFYIDKMLSGSFPKEDTMTFENDSNTYYKISSDQVIKKHKWGYTRLDDATSRSIIDKWNAIQEENKRKEALQKEANKIDELPVPEPIETPTITVTDTDNTATKDTKTQNFINGDSATQLKDVKDLENLKNNPIFANENYALVKEIRNLIKQNFGETLNTPQQIYDWISKKFPGFKLKTKNDLENLKNCHLNINK